MKNLSNAARNGFVYLGIVGVVVPTFVSAHVVVHPREAGIASFQTFTVNVPSEKDSATVTLRLVIPEGLTYVTPTVKPGWSIRVIKEGEGETARVTDIVWEGGRIHGYFRDEFSFSAKVPATEISLAWKAYQRYENGDVVSWNNPPMTEQPKKSDGSPDFSTGGPYSETHIVNDLKKPAEFSRNGNWSIIISGISLLVALAALGFAVKRT